MDVKGDKSSYNFLAKLKSKLRNRTKAFLETKFFSIFSQISELEFSFPLSTLPKDTTSELAGLSPH